jgi:hypothetical protein
MKKICLNVSILLSSWLCRDSRFYIRLSPPTPVPAGYTSAPIVPSFPATCLWYQNYSQTAANLQCMLHHCSSPQVGESSYQPPSEDNQLQLILSAEVNASLVPLGSYVTYNCTPGTFIESNETDPTRNQVNYFCMFF